MAGTALEPEQPLRLHLLQQTEPERERFGRNPLFVRAFADLVEAQAYRRLVMGFHGYYRLLETLIRRNPDWLRTGLDHACLNKSDWLAEDLAVLDMDAGPLAPLAHLPRIRSLSEAAGACFLSEYIAWNSEVAEKHLRLALPRSCQPALRFVTAYGKSRESQWQRHCAWLDSRALSRSQRDACVRAARDGFLGLDAWLETCLDEN
ncbi:biliverdin-producing heme oxygenase [Natronospira bacteriovora]|uniref:Biliverdin-producing heme oxygenase n=1 Tax=Natronospira bacteriovora TaxID=3069753 RepID=A0ABU0W6A1_9GAMM|nr:biliverdin-producing heme oxygenase [Natronospira sp. AB-CW4]MDQ2069552.1 biliverdin-producing heme oxygenase [Natronospira sp. AB-CW4]